MLITAGPTREYIDTVRFITNASSGTMGYAVAAEAIIAGYEVTLLTGPVCLAPPEGAHVIHFESVDELQAAIYEQFEACDALIMAAAVGDFSVRNAYSSKISRKAGPITVELVPTSDILAALGMRRREWQLLIGFSVEDREQAESKARAEMLAKNIDYVVVNTPEAMAAQSSEAAILSRDGIVLPWGHRPKSELANEIVKLLGKL